jgi:hypothetical protein
MGFSYPRARFVSDHLGDVAEAQKAWMEVTWPKTLEMARERKAMLLFGDEASFAQWGSLSYTWARRGKQPTVPTSGTRRAYKVFGLIDFFSGAFFSQGMTGKLNSDSYQAFLSMVLEKTTGHLVIIQDVPYQQSDASILRQACRTSDGCSLACVFTRFQSDSIPVAQPKKTGHAFALFSNVRGFDPKSG